MADRASTAVCYATEIQPARQRPLTRKAAAVCMLHIHEDDLSDPQSRRLISLHLAGMVADVPPGALFLGLSELQRPNVTVWSAWDGPRIASIGALKMLPDGTGEIKSMRTHPDLIGRGAGARILATIVDAAKARGIRRLSLETGSGPSFEAARALYEKFGFREGEPYSAYVKTDFNHFLHLQLLD
ncbi:acetyltransferase, GNAT family protein [Acaromyces ingoldii]|uniref:Acetyltransferase, GNAT family protein n=1 Tax=Acaromyces ingoldii TaxID=215250 RepID=A0A316YGR3_9BASI|nr:acetyltransferase, GNAT family protein [Acaromyces ingoldii]PWN87293.1 acetyltransferase, GNAT family protein [Acaromyces ingoldii]